MLAVVSPASAAKAELVRAGLRALQALGYETVLMPHALDRGPLYYAGTAEERVADLHAAFADPTMDGIVCTRGGWGSAELLPLLDAELVRANPKVFVGYSDHTSLHVWLRTECGLVTFYGPMVAADFATDGWRGCARAGERALEGDAAWSRGGGGGSAGAAAGVAEGALMGGCLSIFAEALGTPYARSRLTGRRAVSGGYWDEAVPVGPDAAASAVCGHAGGCDGDGVWGYEAVRAAEEMELLEAAILHALRDFAGPIAIGLRSGHVDGANVTLPLGVRVRLELATSAGVRGCTFSKAR